MKIIKDIFSFSGINSGMNKLYGRVFDVSILSLYINCWNFSWAFIISSSFISNISLYFSLLLISSFVNRLLFLFEDLKENINVIVNITIIIFVNLFNFMQLLSGYSCNS